MARQEKQPRKRKAAGFNDIFHYSNQIDFKFGATSMPSKLSNFAEELNDSSSSDEEEQSKKNKPRGEIIGKELEKHVACGKYENGLVISDDEIQWQDKTEDLVTLNDSLENPPSPPPPPKIDTPTLIQQSYRGKGGRKLREVESTLFFLKQASESQTPSSVTPQRRRPLVQDGIILLDDDPIPFSPEKPLERDMVVKVRTRSGIQRLNMKAGEPFSTIIPELARREGIPEDKILLTLKGEGINLFSSPHSLGVTVADILECITSQAEGGAEVEIDDEDCIEVKVQGENAKQTKTYKIRMNDPLQGLMAKYCSEMNLPAPRVHFSFDGDKISPQDTAESLDMEDGSMIDVRVK